MEGDEQLEMFCHREFPRLVGTLTLYCGDRDVAEDLAQEALVRTVRRWSTVSQMAAPGAWVHRVAVNLANSHFRRRKAALRARIRQRSGPVIHGHVDPDTANAVALRRAVSRLPTRQRTALVLRYYADLSTAQVADAMDIAPSSVKTYVSRALENLRDDLGVTGRALVVDLTHDAEVLDDAS